jgi:hypothetical protein
MTGSLVGAAAEVAVAVEVEAAFTAAAARVPEVSTAAATGVVPWQVARAGVMP